MGSTEKSIFAFRFKNNEENMKHIIDVDTWARRDNYRFFQSFVSSWYAVTTEIDCTEAREAARWCVPPTRWMNCATASTSRDR